MNIIQGDALTQLQTLDAESVDCCITSPPYWALRDYKVDGQLGLEPTIGEYINKLVSIFDQVRRVLKQTGTCWTVLGDTYDSNKSLSLIPERFAISMIDRGWILRNKIIWYKPNCMPSSAKDRFTVDWEYVYFFTKSQRYYFETQYEPMSRIYEDRTFDSGKKKSSNPADYWPNPTMDRRWGGDSVNEKPNPLGRIKRCVWKISTKPFSGAHFAVFPPDLVEPMIKAGCPEYVCQQCGKARMLQYEWDGTMNNHRWGKPGKLPNEINLSQTSTLRTGLAKNKTVLGMSDCGCNAGFDSGTVLDPFMGAGTTGMVAMQNARNFIGIELNPDYIELAKKRLEPWMTQTKLPLVVAN